MALNLMFEDDASLQYDTKEILNEATGKAEKKYHIRGTFSTIGVRNRNGRVYPRALWEREVQNYQNVINSGSINTLMEVEHPPRTAVDPMKAVAKIESLTIEGDRVIGDAVLLDNDQANQLKTLIDNGIKISVSSRACGSYDANGTVKEFKLITYDIVANPSDYNATMNGMCESHMMCEGVVQDLNYTLTDDGRLVLESKVEEPKEELIPDSVEKPEEPKEDTEEKKETFTKADVSEAVISRFENFMGELLKSVDTDSMKDEFLKNENRIREVLPKDAFIRKVKTLRIRICDDSQKLYDTNFMDIHAKATDEMSHVDLDKLYEKLVDKLKRYSSIDVSKLKYLYLNNGDIDVQETLNGLPRI